MKYSLITVLGLALAAVTAFGQTAAKPLPAGALSAAQSSPAPTPGLQKHHPRYLLKKGDSFDLEFEFSPEFNQTVVIQPDGYVTLKDIGSVYVEGQSVPALTNTLQAAYSKMLHDPVITVVLKDFEKPYFIMAGEVAKPGKYDLRGSITMTEAVAIAGGFNGSAKHSQVVLFRPVANGMFETKIVNIKKLLASHNLSEDIYMKPGDMVYVPQNTISKISKYLPSSSLGAFYNPASLF